MNLCLRKPSPAMVVACISLFIGLSGVGTAAVVLAKNSVLSKHIKNGQVKRADLGANAVNSAKVGDGSLLAQDFAAGQLPAGQGVQGPAGPQGPPGPSTGAAGGDLTGTYPNPQLAANSVGTAEVANGSLTSNDVGLISGTTNYNAPSLAAGTCTYDLVSPGVGDIDNNPIVVIADDLVAETVIAAAWRSNVTTAFRLRVCNVGNTTIDPPAADYHWVIFNN